LVLIRASARKTSLDRKSYDQWFGPCIVIRPVAGGAYICTEMNGTVIGERIARDRVVPYFARRKMQLPENLEDWIDVSRTSLREILGGPLKRLLKGVDDLMQEVDLPGQRKLQSKQLKTVQ
jgi:hypothetical protein